MVEILFRSKEWDSFNEFAEVSFELRALAETVKAWLLGGRSFREIKKELEYYSENLEEGVKIKRDGYTGNITIELNGETAIIKESTKNKNFKQYNKVFKEFIKDGEKFDVEIKIMHKKLYNALKRRLNNVVFEEKTEKNKKVWTAKATVDKKDLEKIYKAYRRFVQSQNCDWDRSIYYEVQEVGYYLSLIVDYADIYTTLINIQKSY